ncbi:hypothetical protein LCGC14_1791860 [marine sediment metagenome]|uniref:ParB-like N-terminal domain-containing protein n=1 Tax=marine sediment metagenome TaxID=412755 RepID=A0A0F9GSB9_9ZZZZ
MSKRKKDVFLNVQVKKIIDDPDVPNIRGPLVGDTIELQASIKIRGVEEPLWVRPGHEKFYYLIDGHRRLAAARIVGLKEIPVLVKDIGPAQGVELMLTADMREKQPHIVLGESGRVVGGLCWAFHYELGQGKRQIDIAAARGVTADVVGAYNSLYDDLTEVKQAVANGRLAITVYSLFKHADWEFKIYLMARKKLSARSVRKEISDWPTTKKKLKDGSARGPGEKAVVGQDKEVPRVVSALPTAAHINSAYVNILAIEDRELEKTDFELMDRLLKLVKDTLRIDYE